MTDMMDADTVKETLEKQIVALRADVLAATQAKFVGLSQLVVALVVVMGALWGLAIKPISDSIIEIKDSLKTMATKEEFLMFEADVKSLDVRKLDRTEMVDKIAALDARIEEMNRRLARIK
jgi:hypothetical protein